MTASCGFGAATKDFVYLEAWGSRTACRGCCGSATLEGSRAPGMATVATRAERRARAESASSVASTRASSPPFKFAAAASAAIFETRPPATTQRTTDRATAASPAAWPASQSQSSGKAPAPPLRPLSSSSFGCGASADSAVATGRGPGRGGARPGPHQSSSRKAPRLVISPMAANARPVTSVATGTTAAPSTSAMRPDSSSRTMRSSVEA
mmetsp:Transcript_16451/g.55534  ORF Transcript_16451/g.55534 Transcript_16451/m.55534 type:complete len:210 (+) Transcript_16451:516-1145(+)